MLFSKASRVVGALASMFVLHGAASAASVGTGTFNISGTVYVTNTSFLFGYNSLPTATSADQVTSIVLPTSGAFAGLAAGDKGMISNLLTPTNGGTFGPGPVVPGSSFTLAPFIQLPTVGINLDLSGTNPLPVSSNPVCSGTSFDTPGSICAAQRGSPVTLQQGFGGVSALISLSGRAYFAGSNTYMPFTGKFNAAFGSAPDTTISGLLADLATNGFIRTGYQASLSTTGSSPTVPEPASMALIGAGLFALGIFGKKKLIS